jgi:hypothetical protein
MRKQQNFFIPTLAASILIGITLPLAMTTRPIDWDRFFLIMALSFSLVWAIYSIILLGYVFLVEGRRRRNKSETRKEEESFHFYSVQEWEALWEITVKKDDSNQKKCLWN